MPLGEMTTVPVGITPVFGWVHDCPWNGDHHCVTNYLYYNYDLRMSLYLVLVLWSPVSDVIYGLSVRASMV